MRELANTRTRANREPTREKKKNSNTKLTCQNYKHHRSRYNNYGSIDLCKY